MQDAGAFATEAADVALTTATEDDLTTAAADEDFVETRAAFVEVVGTITFDIIEVAFIDAGAVVAFCSHVRHKVVDFSHGIHTTDV